MRLHLINDLPLFLRFSDLTVLDNALADGIEQMASAIPAEVAFISFASVEQWWSTCRCLDVDACILIGTRPKLLHTRLPVMPRNGLVASLETERRLNSRGETFGARLKAPVSATTLAELSGVVCVIDDVLMSGRTVLCALQALRSCVHITGLTLLIYVANGRSLARVSHLHPELQVTARMILDYQPIVEGTAIFLHDLFFGSLRGKPFLDQRALLQPYLGEDLSPVIDLRNTVASLVPAGLRLESAGQPG